MKHYFYKGKENILSKETDFEKIKEIIKKDLSKILDTRNLSFLIGSGCSLGENGISTMKELADNLFEPKALRKRKPIRKLIGFLIYGIQNYKTSLKLSINKYKK